MEAVAEAVEPGVLPDPDPLASGSRGRPTTIIASAPPAAMTARWIRFAPATKNIVNAVSVMTIGRAEVRLLEDEGDDRRDDDQERRPSRPRSRGRRVPRLANQWAR